MVPAKVKLGQAVLDLNLPAWLVVRLRLSSTVANSGTFFYLYPNFLDCAICRCDSRCGTFDTLRLTQLFFCIIRKLLGNTTT